MATVEDDETPSESDPAWWSATGFEHRYGVDRLTATVGAVVVVALLLRFVGIGSRIAHWDEARVGLWILNYAQTGAFEYRPIIHGPFYHHVNKYVFAVFGANDATMRFAAALIGGLFPLSALLFRDRFDDLQVLSLAFFLALNPVLLYYSRFMRGDIVVGAFAFTAFALFLRVIDTGRPRYLFAGMGSLALAFTAKENAVLYLVTWAGATLLVLDHRLLPFADRESPPDVLLKRYVRTTARRVWNWLHWLLLGTVEFVVIIVFFYAPRASEPGEIGLWRAFGQPSTFPAVIEAATVGAWQKLWGLWVAGGGPGKEGIFENYPQFLGDLLLTLGYGGLALCLLALVGFLADRYTGDGPSDLVAFGFYCGIASLFGYPLAADIKAPWIAIHVLLPLALPAAVGLAMVLRWARDAVARDDSLDAGIAALLLLVIVGQVAGAGLWGVFLAPQSENNELVQFAQPGGEMRPTIHELRAASAENEGTDVLVYGEHFASSGTSIAGLDLCMRWGNTLPLNWYFQIHDASVDCAANATALDRQIQDGKPPIVIGRSSDREVLRQRFPEYQVAEYELRTFGSETVFYVSPEYASGEVGDSGK